MRYYVRSIFAVRHITCAEGANIDLLEYNFLRPFSLALYVRISLAVYGKYHAACGISLAPLAQISIYLNIPSSTVAATTVRPLLGGAAPFSSRFQRATFPAIGKVYPTKIASQSGKGWCGGESRWARTSLAEGGEGLQRRATGWRKPMGAYFSY